MFTTRFLLGIQMPRCWPAILLAMMSTACMPPGDLLAGLNIDHAGEIVDVPFNNIQLMLGFAQLPPIVDPCNPETHAFVGAENSWVLDESGSASFDADNDPNFENLAEALAGGTSLRVAAMEWHPDEGICVEVTPADSEGFNNLLLGMDIQQIEFRLDGFGLNVNNQGTLDVDLRYSWEFWGFFP